MRLNLLEKKSPKIGHTHQRIVIYEVIVDLIRHIINADGGFSALLFTKGRFKYLTFAYSVWNGFGLVRDKGSARRIQATGG
jgi:hypothetical protein